MKKTCLYCGGPVIRFDGEPERPCVRCQAGSEEPAASDPVEKPRPVYRRRKTPATEPCKGPNCRNLVPPTSKSGLCLSCRRYENEHGIGQHNAFTMVPCRTPKCPGSAAEGSKSGLCRRCQYRVKFVGSNAERAKARKMKTVVS